MSEDKDKKFIELINLLHQEFEKHTGITVSPDLVNFSNLKFAFSVADEYRAENAKLREALQSCANSMLWICRNHICNQQLSVAVLGKKLEELKQLSIEPKGE